MKSQTRKAAGKASLDPLVVRGFRASDADLALLRAEDERVRQLAPVVWSAALLPYQRRARITPRLISTARRAKSFWERMTHNTGLHRTEPAAGSGTVRGLVRDSV